METFKDALSYLTDGSNWSGEGGLTSQLNQQLLLTVVALLVACAIALPVALWLGHIGKGGAIAINLSNIGRAVPVFAVLGLLSVGFLGSDEFGPFGRAGLATLVSLVLFALPPLVTNTYVGMRELDRDVIEAARGMGLSARRVFTQVELPLAFPMILTGLRQATVQVWATATIAALVAGPGLGNTITSGFAVNDTAKVVAGAILVAVVALILEGLLALAERFFDPMRRAHKAERLSRRGPSTTTQLETA